MEKAAKPEVAPPPVTAPHRPLPSAPLLPLYSLPPCRFVDEDILFCIDVDVESHAELKQPTAKSRPFTRFHAVEAAIRHFVHAKLFINPDHRFALSALTSSFSWIKKEFTNEAAVFLKALRQLQVLDAPFGAADLTALFRTANQQAIKSRSEGRLLRVVLIYCRSSTMPQHRWPVGEKLFTMDVLYLHDKPGPENCPQAVFDALVDALEHVSEFDGYILESSQSLPRIVCRLMYTLLCHPQQRCSQEDLEIPRSIAKRLPPASEAVSNDENLSMSSTSYN